MSPAHLALMLAVDVVWGLNFVVSKAGVEAWQPMFFAALRFLLLSVILAPWLRLVPGRMRMVALFAFCMGFLHFVLVLTGMSLTDNVSSVAIAIQTNVPFATLLAVMFLGERIRWRRTLGIVMAFAGVIVIGFDPIVFEHLDALALILLAAFSGAAGTVMARYLRDIPAFTLNAWIGVLSGLPLLALSLVTEQGHLDLVRNAGVLEWGFVVGSCVGASLFGHSALYYLLARYPVNVVSTLTLLAPIFGIVFGVLIWGDVLTWKLALGAAVTFLGVGIITLRSGRPRPAPAQ